jgi:hypothetical protein
MTLYRVTTAKGAKPTPSFDVADGHTILTGTSTEVVGTAVTLNGNETPAWNHTWEHLPVGSATEDYTYYVVETAGNAGTVASYAYNYVGGDATSDANTGAKHVTVTNRETSVRVEKKWVDAATGANTASQHAGDTVQVALYCVKGSPTVGSPESVTNLVLPSGLDREAALVDNDLVSGIKNPIVLNLADTETNGAGVGVWDYAWVNLPLKDRFGNDLYYFVEEVQGDGANPLATYA